MSNHEKELDALWERAAHGTHREDLHTAYGLGLAAGRQEQTVEKKEHAAPNAPEEPSMEAARVASPQIQGTKMREWDFCWTDLPMGEIPEDWPRFVMGFECGDPNNSLSVLVTRRSAERMALELMRLVKYGQSGTQTANAITAFSVRPDAGMDAGLSAAQARISELDASVLALTTQLAEQRQVTESHREMLRLQMALKDDYLAAADKWSERAEQAEADLAAQRRPGQAAQEARELRGVLLDRRETFQCIANIGKSRLLVPAGAALSNVIGWAEEAVKIIDAALARNTVLDPPGRSSASGPGERKVESTT